MENTSSPSSKRFWKFLLPVIVFAVLFVFLLLGLNLKPSEVPSPLIGKKAPSFMLPVLNGSQANEAQPFHSQSLHGKVWLLNVWASWCVACRVEHPVLMDMSRDPRFVIIGLDYKDAPQDAARWLERHGNPYDLVVTDAKGHVGLDFGVYGVPETFVIDQDGVIRYKQIGPLTEADVRTHILPLLAAATQPQ